MKKILLSCILSAITCSVYAQNNVNNFNLNENLPESEMVKVNGYLIDSWGHAVRTSDGSCVRTGSYDANTAYHPECNPIIVKEVMKIPESQIEKLPESRKIEPIIQNNQPIVHHLRVYFDFDSAVLNKEAKEKLNHFLENVQSSNEGNEKLVKIVAAADFIGTNSYNQKLSEKRAYAIEQYLLNLGIDNVRDVSGIGENRARLQDTPECKGLNSKKELIKCIEKDRVGSVIVFTYPNKYVEKE